MGIEDDLCWTGLVGALGSFARVEDREPHGLVVTALRADSTSTVVEIVMTQEDWDDLVSISWGSVETAAQHVRQLVMDQPHEQRYLVYSQYELVPCGTPELPVDPDLLRLQELAAQYPGVVPGGRWAAHSPERDSRP